MIKTKIKLPKKARTVFFKHEDEVSGIAVGPVTIDGKGYGWMQKPEAMKIAAKIGAKWEEF